MNEATELIKRNETVELLKAQNELLKKLIAVYERTIEDKDYPISASEHILSSKQVEPYLKYAERDQRWLSDVYCRYI